MIKHFKAVADALLKKHYGVDLFDTELAADKVVTSYVKRGRRPYEAVNSHARRTSLGRIDRPLYQDDLSREPLSAEDEDAVLASLADELSQSCAA